ncbi:MAG: class II aldolase/adducin family protein [Pseudomonadota bacterium]
MSEEGVIQFRCELGGRQRPVTSSELRELIVWRQIAGRLSLLGQEPDRYGGYAFGNISERRGQGFEISASQSAHLDCTDPRAWCQVTTVDFDGFSLSAEGDLPPSSESITHAMLYAADPDIGGVIHAHSPALWQRAEELGMPTTAADVPYGTPALGDAVRGLLAAHPARPLTFATLGHEDGIFTVAPDLHAAGAQLLADYARALAATL